MRNFSEILISPRWSGPSHHAPPPSKSPSVIMSLISDNQGKFLLHKWNIPDIQLKDDFKTKADSTALWELVPTTTDVGALAKWFFVKIVENPTDSTRRFKVYHSREESAPEDDDYEVELRLQGVLSSFNFARGGNWSG